MKKIRHDIRLAETISPFGVGAIVDIQGESLIAKDTSCWTNLGATIYCDRLVNNLTVPGNPPPVLKQAPTHSGPVLDKTPVIPYLRFPSWRFCSGCSRLTSRTSSSKGKYRNRCQECGAPLVPMRYIAVCESGSHIQDIPWFQWTHRGNDGGVTEEVRVCRDYDALKFKRSSTEGEGLKSLSVECGGCRRKRSLVDLVNLRLVADGIQCEGKQPWELDSAPCADSLTAVQRGATGNYLAERVTALDIPLVGPPIQQDAAAVREHADFGRLVQDGGGPKSELISQWIADEVGVEPSFVMSVAFASSALDAGEGIDLKDGEWGAFLSELGDEPAEPNEDFVVDRADLTSTSSSAPTLLENLQAVGQVRRLREVRALKGFRRNKIDANLMSAYLADARSRSAILPAVENYGEGVFLKFSEESLTRWEEREDVLARMATIRNGYSNAQWAHRYDTPEPRLVALHTLSHLLIRRLAYASGYSSASLQERIYANSTKEDRTAGVLIYTAAGDSEGTLGGLVRQGAPDLLVPLLIGALSDADSCSNDPVCAETKVGGSHSLNLSACHGCSLVSETSCEFSNVFLDRQLLLGGSEVQGLLQGVLDEARAAI